MTEQSEDSQRPSPTTSLPAVTSTDPRALAAAAVTVLLWASAFIVIRDLGRAVAPAPMAFGRLAVAALALTVLVLVQRRAAPLPRLSGRAFGLIAVYGLLWLAGYTVALNVAERHVDAGTAAMLVNLAPLLVALVAGRWFDEGYPPQLVIGLLVAFGGVSVIAFGSTAQRDGVGVGLCLLAAVLYAAGVLVQKVVLRHTDGLTTVWLGCVIGALALLPWGGELVGELAAAPATATLSVLYLGIFPTALGFSLWSYALRRMPANRLSATTYAAPALSVLLSWLLLGEMPTIYGLLGGAACLIGVAISRKKSA